jgi:hypothetical protein
VAILEALCCMSDLYLERVPCELNSLAGCNNPSSQKRLPGLFGTGVWNPYCCSGVTSMQKVQAPHAQHAISSTNPALDSLAGAGSAMEVQQAWPSSKRQRRADPLQEENCVWRQLGDLKVRSEQPDMAMSFLRMPSCLHLA